MLPIYILLIAFFKDSNVCAWDSPKKSSVDTYIVYIESATSGSPDINDALKVRGTTGCLAL